MKPRLLDLYSGAGGAARGYQLAGFHVTGVDINPQPRYAGDHFIQGDALEYLEAHGDEYEAVHASPPCQNSSLLTKGNRGRRGWADRHVDLIPAPTGPHRQAVRHRKRGRRRTATQPDPSRGDTARLRRGDRSLAAQPPGGDRVKTHPYAASTHLDHRGVPYCTCGSRKDDRIHQLPQQDPDVTDYERRKTGDR